MSLVDGFEGERDDRLGTRVAFPQEPAFRVGLDFVLKGELGDAGDDPEEAVGFDERALGSEDGEILPANPDFSSELGEETLLARANEDARFRFEGDDGSGFAENFFIGQTCPEVAVAEGIFMDGVG